MSSGDATTPELTADIIADILSLLPVRPLCQFKCVSKPFLSLISNPNFIKQHLVRYTKNKQRPEKLFLILDTSDCYSLDLESPNLSHLPLKFGSEQNPLRFSKIYGSCNGLLLLSGENSSLFIVNPSTRDFRELPRSQFFINSELACDKYGFGFDESCDDYKVVRISYDMFNRVGNSVSVYDFRADTWREINNCPYEIARYANPEGVLLNGALHWLCGGDVGIVSLNLSNETFTSLSFPNNVRENFQLESLGVIRGCLSGVDYYSYRSYGPIDVWVMENYGTRDSWKRFRIDCSLSIIEWTLPLRSGKVLLNDGTNLLLHHPNEFESQQLEVQGFQADVVAMGYDESLLRLQERD